MDSVCSFGTISTNGRWEKERTRNYYSMLRKGLVKNVKAVHAGIQLGMFHKIQCFLGTNRTCFLMILLTMPYHID